MQNKGGSGVRSKDVISDPAKIDELWKSVDLDGSGYIEKDELERLLFVMIQKHLETQNERIPKSKKQIQDLLDRLIENVMNFCDSNEDGKLSRQEFQRFVLWLNNMDRFEI